MLSISNIAWDVSQDNEVAKVLNENNVAHVDIAPPKYFENISTVKHADVLRVKNYWQNKGISPLGMQALLFGTKGLNVFGSENIQCQLLQHLTHVCKVGSILGARKLVFGSPRNRDRSHLDDSSTVDIAISFFRRLGDIAKKEGVYICLEPNPECYHSNFMTNSVDTATIVSEVSHPNIRMQLDIGAMYINDESPMEIIKSFAPLIHHIHISEPQLLPINKNNAFHKKASEAINEFLPSMPMTIEMLTTDSKLSIGQIRGSIEIVNRIYRGL